MIDFQNALFLNLKRVDAPVEEIKQESEYQAEENTMPEEQTNETKTEAVQENKPSSVYGVSMPALIDGESVVSTYKCGKESVVFTNKRIITVKPKGVTGRKYDITSMPYKNVQLYSVKSSRAIDINSELQVCFSGLGKVSFEFIGTTNINEICTLISQAVL